MQIRAPGPHPVGGVLERGTVGGQGRVRHDQAEVNIADQCAEPAVGEAAQRIGGDESAAKNVLTGRDRVGQHTFTLFVGRLAHANENRQIPIAASRQARGAQRFNRQCGPYASCLVETDHIVIAYPNAVQDPGGTLPNQNSVKSDPAIPATEKEPMT